MDSQKIKELDKKHVMQTYGRFDAVIERGEGARLYSPEGKKYIDLTSGIGVNSIGYGNKAWAEAIFNQALKLGHISNLYYTGPYALLAAELTERSGMDKAFFSNSGAESNEGLIKLARKYSHDKYGGGRNVVLTLTQSFHGRTVTTLAATGQDSFHKHFFPFTEGFRHVPANEIEALEAALGTGDVCAVLAELVQGEGGVLPLDADYVKTAKAACEARDVLFLADEVQTGIGRTGTLFAYEQYDIVPDAVSFAKGIAGGLPMGGILTSEKTSAVLGAGDHATTFGGNPVTAAAALEVLRQLDGAALNQVTESGKYIRETIISWGLPMLGTPRGAGLMIGIPVSGASPKEIARKCVENGLLILTAGADALRILPPLVITREEIDEGLALLKSVLSAF